MRALLNLVRAFQAMRGHWGHERGHETANTVEDMRVLV
jgi:hypothetical protein